MPQNTSEKPPVSHPFMKLLPTLLAFGSLVLYVLTLSPGAFPGPSAKHIADHLWLEPFPPMSNPVWGWLVELFSRLPIAASLAARINVLNAVCGAACVAFVYVILSRLPASVGPMPVEDRRHVVTPIRAIVSSIGALYFALAVPTWVASTRADPVLWGLLLTLAATYCLLRYWSGRLIRWAAVGCFLVALGATGYGTMIAIAPVYAFVLFVFVFRNGQMRLRTFLVFALAFVIGLLPLLFHAIAFMNTKAYEWREFKGLGQVLFYMARDLYWNLRSGIPKYGWFMIGLVSLAPWMMVVIFRLGQNRKVAPGSRWGGYILNFVLTILGFALPFAIPITPWTMTGLHSPMVMPYLLIAMWYGVLAGFWYIELVHESRLSWRKPAAAVVVALFAVVPLVAAFQNRGIADGRSSRLVHAYLDETLTSVEKRAWIVTGGMLESDLAIRAHEKNSPLKMLSQAQGYQSGYLRYVATFFQNPRLQAIAQVGLTPLLNEWFSSDPMALTNVAIQGMADLWFTGGSRPLPQQVVFVSDHAGVNPEALLAASKTSWARLRADRDRWPDENPAVGYHKWILAQASKVANNLGVYLEDAGRSDLARDAYLESRILNTNNLSALLNLYTLARLEKRPESGTYEKELRETLKGISIRNIIWSLGRYYGYVRTPELYAGRGYAWALSGKPNLALSEMRRAMEMSGGGSGGQLALAGMYLTQNQADESEQAYLNVLRQSPTNIPALFGIARATVRQGKFDDARGYLNRLRELKAPVAAVMREEVVVASLSGDLPGAMKILSDGLKKYPEDRNLWVLMAAIASDAGDARNTQAALEKLAGDRTLPSGMHLALGQVYLKQGDRLNARRRFEDALRAAPSSIQALEALIRIDIADRKREEAERHIQMLLTADPRNALGNYTLGTLQVFNGQYALAEASFRASLATRRSVETVNDLAWVLARQGNHREALGYATEAIQMSENNGNSWDTLGVIQMKLGDLDKAEKSLQKAMSLQPENPAIALNMAELYEAKGMLKEAEQLAEQLLARAAQLDREMQDKLNALTKRLRERRGAI